MRTRPDAKALLDGAIALVSPTQESISTPAPNRLDICIDVQDLVGMTTMIHAARWGRLSAITGLDRGEQGIEVLYHFCSGPAILTLRVMTPRDAPHVPTICGEIPAAGLFERELAEMLGVCVDNTPDPSRLYLSDDWPDRTYPLRKDMNETALKNAAQVGVTGACYGDLK